MHTTVYYEYVNYTHRKRGGYVVEYKTVRRTSRYSLVTDIHVTDVQSGIQISGQTSEVSLFGCGLKSLELFTQGAIVTIKLVYRGEEVKAVITATHPYEARHV